MKPILLFTAAAFVFTACDGEKAQEAKQKATEAGKAAGDAAKALGEAAKEITGKGVEKAKEFSGKAVEKTKELAGNAGQLIKEKGGPAVESFKAKLGGFSEWVASQKGAAGKDPEKAKQIMSELFGRLKGLSAEGLPDDVRKALGDYQSSMGEYQQILRSLPTEATAAGKWFEENIDRLHAIEVKTGAAQKALKEVAARYGLTGLHLGTDPEEPVQ